MPGEFRIASGYIEVTTRVDKEKIKAAAREAAAAMDAEMAAAATKTGQTVGENIRKKVKEKTDQAGTESGDSLRKKLGDSVGDGRFASEFKAKIGQALKDLPNIKVNADTKGAELQVADLRLQLDSLRNKRIGVDIDSGKATAELLKIKAELEALSKDKTGSASLRVDTSAAAKDLGAFTSMVKSTVTKAGEDVSNGLFSKISDKLDGFMTQAVQTLGSLPGKIGGAFGSMLGKVLGIFGAVGGFILRWGSIVGGALQIAPPIIDLIAAGLASLPALAVGAAGAIATLGLGFHGIGAAIGEVFNPTAGNSAAQAAGQVASAERALTLAQRSAADAQIALNLARQQAINDLIDMNLQLSRAHLDEQAAILQVRQAEIDLATARNTVADPLAVQRAQLALEQANQSLQEAKQHTVEQQQATDAANAAGVEGATNVKSALEQVQSTQFAVLDAQNNLKQAFLSSAAAGITAYSQLSTNARAFVDEIRKLKPSLTDLQHYVQDQLFAGLGAKLDTWAHVWMPGLRKDLGALAGDANQFLKRLGDDLSKPEVRQAIDGVFGAMDRVFQRFTTGGALDKLVKGFGDLVTAATPFVEKLANGVLDELGKLGDWIDKKSKNGQLSKFFSDAAHDAKELWGITKDVFGIIGDIIGIASGKEQKGANGNPLDQLKDTLDKIKKWVESDSGKKTISDIIQFFHDVGGAVFWVVQKVDALIHDFLEFKRQIGIIKDDVQSFGTAVENGFRDMERNVVSALGKMLDGADSAFGWIPGLGGKLDTAKAQFEDWSRSITGDLAAIPDHKDITLALQYDKSKYSGAAPNQNAGHRMGAVLDWSGGQAFQSFAEGGVFPGIQGGFYRFAEAETRRELLMPENSPDQRRQQVLASTAATWAGGTFQPGAAQQPSAPARLGPYHIHVGGQPLVSMMVDAITGNPTVVAAAAQAGNRKRAYTNVRVTP